MNKEKINRLMGFLGLVTLIIGAMLYAVNSPMQMLTNVLLIAGAVIFAVFFILNIKAIAIFSKRRSSRYGANMLVMVILFSCIIVFLQAISSRHSHRFDLTKNKRFSLAGQTINLLKKLDKDIEIHAFYKMNAAEKRRAQDLISQYTHRSDRIRERFIDPDRKPQIAKDMGITSYGTTVVRCGEKREVFTFLSEESLTNAILKVVREEIKAIYLVHGHGEKDPDAEEMNGFSTMKKAIEAESYSVNKLSLFEERAVPGDCYILLVGGPTKDYFDSEINKIEQYLSQGRNAIFMIDPRTVLPNLEKLLARYGIELENNVVIDPFSRAFGSDYMVPVVTQYEKHPITKGFNIATFFPLARSLTIIERDNGTNVRYLAKTGKSAWGETDLEAIKRGEAERDENDVPPPVPIAAVASRAVQTTDSLPSGQKQPETKIVVFGDSDFATNSAFGVSGNADLLLNTISYLAEEEDLISIRPKSGTGDRLFLKASQGRFIFLITVILLPLAVISTGTTIYMRRRKSG